MWHYTTMFHSLGYNLGSFQNILSISQCPSNVLAGAGCRPENHFYLQGSVVRRTLKERHLRL